MSVHGRPQGVAYKLHNSRCRIVTKGTVLKESSLYAKSTITIRPVSSSTKRKHLITTNSHNLVDRYIDGVMSGEIVVGKLVKASVERHLSDIDRQGSDDFPYHYSAGAAEAAIEFFPNCLKHSIGDHSKHQFFLEPWQAFGTAMVFGWKRDADNCRRFQRVLWETGRKNGKSTFWSGAAIQLACDDFNPLMQDIEQVAEVVLAATKIEQSYVIYNEIERMRDSSEHIRSISKTAYHRVHFMENYGTIRCIGSDKPYSGLNPLGIIIDEYHEFTEKHRKFMETMETSMGSRSQPLMVVTTTAGDDRSFLWIHLYNYCKDILAGLTKDEEVFPYIFECDPEDDILDEANWPKANPNLGISLKLNYLRGMARKAKHNRIDYNTFDRFHANRLVSSIEQAFDPEVWAKCEGELSDWKTASAIGGGCDLGARDDLAAWALVARFETDNRDDQGNPVWRYEAKVQAYIGEDTVRDVSKPPFGDWIYSGLLRQAKYPISDMRADLVAECRKYYVADIAYDPYNGQQFAEEIDREGLVIASMAQNFAHFNEPIRELMQALIDGRFRHDGNPLLSWCVKNAILISDRQTRWMYDKRDSSEKIDPVVAMTMAFRRAMVAPSRAKGSLFVS